MAEDAQTYRGRPNVRNRALRSASRWDELAMQAERAEVAAMGRLER